MARSKVKWRTHYDVSHWHPLTNVPTKYPLPTPYGFHDIDQTRFLNSRALRQSQSSNHVSSWRCTSTPPNQYPYEVSTSNTFRLLRYSPGKLFPAVQSLKLRPPVWTPWVKTIPDSTYGCGVKMSTCLCTNLPVQTFGPKISISLDCFWDKCIFAFTQNIKTTTKTGGTPIFYIWLCFSTLHQKSDWNCWSHTISEVLRVFSFHFHQEKL